MADKPIIFRAPMVQALLDGRKTQDRRVLRLRGYKDFHQFGVSDTAGYDWTFRRADWVWEDFTHERLLQLLPYTIGDRLWVQEACVTWEGSHRDAVYRSDLSKNEWSDLLSDARNGARWKLRSSINMPRWASRLTLTVTDVRVQRLQDISREDAVAEGMASHGPNRPQDDFRDLCNSLHGPEAWDENPWVEALTFNVQHGNIDQIGGE